MKRYRNTFLVTILATGLMAGASPGATQDLIFQSGFESGDASDWSSAVGLLGKPAALPTFVSLGLYDGSSPLNTPIPASPGIDPGSAAMISNFAGEGPLVIQVRQYSAPIFIADATTPLVDVDLLCGPVWGMGVSQLKNVPVPPWSEPADDVDGAVNPPVGCGEDADQDNHMVILDPTTRCEYDFWQARSNGGTWQASWGNSLSMDSSGIYPGGLSTRGSGFAFPGGLIWPDELASGTIGHALVFSMPSTRSGGPVAPATDSDGITAGTQAVPEGARLQLDPSLDLDSLGLTGAERTIAEALQTYGMFCVDTGGSSGIGLYAVDPRSVVGDPYAGLLADQDFVGLPGIPLASFRVLTMGAQDPSWQDDLALLASGCGSLE